jgi:hypothetical protein
LQAASIYPDIEMNPFHQIANTTILTLGLVLQCALVYVVFRRGVARRFPLFAALLVFQPVRSALLFGLSGRIDSSLAISVYGVLSFIDAALQVMVAVELARRLIRGMGGWTHLRALLCLALLCAASVFAFGALVLVPHRIFNDRLQLFAWFVLLALFGAVLSGSRSPNLTRISAGFSAFSLMQFAALAGRTVAFLHRDAGQYLAWSYLPAAGYFAIVVFWLIALQKESEQPGSTLRNLDRNP